MDKKFSQEIPETISHNGVAYKKGKLLGRGGFAKCYEFIDSRNYKIYAVKIVSKANLIKDKHRLKMKQEIDIHKSLKHKNIVKFFDFFEDSNFVYILLEVCGKRSLMEMHKRRKVVTEPELRYYVKQIIEACIYLHGRQIVHRDLKLGNLFLNDDLQVKVGDFGLASILVSGERKKTLCGTPNYIAPEVLLESGHGFEVDVWSLGCIVYTLAVGRPPFETDDLKNTYRKIKKNDYTIPASVNRELAKFINKMLQADPSKRPSMKALLNDEYMRNYIPSCLPVSCLSMAPRMNDNRLSVLCADDPRRPFNDKTNNVKKLAPVKEDQEPQPQAEQIAAAKDSSGANFYLGELRTQVLKLMSPKLLVKDPNQEDDAEHPASMPFFWVSKWVDYTDKYGIGYQLCDNSLGVLFNDSTKLVLMPDEVNLCYIDTANNENYYKFADTPRELEKKSTLFRYFRNYMNSHLMKMGEKVKEELGEKEEMTRVPHVNNWFRTASAIVFHLTNGTVQINFFKDHTKLILCPMMSAVTFVNEKGEFRCFKYSLMHEYGMSSALFQRMKYAKEVIDHLYTKVV